MHKSARNSSRLQEKYKQKGKVDNLLTDSKTDQTKPLSFGITTFIDYILFMSNLHNI